MNNIHLPLQYLTDLQDALVWNNIRDCLADELVSEAKQRIMTDHPDWYHMVYCKEPSPEWSIGVTPDGNFFTVTLRSFNF